MEIFVSVFYRPGWFDIESSKMQVEVYSVHSTKKSVGNNRLFKSYKSTLNRHYKIAVSAVPLTSIDQLSTCTSTKFSKQHSSKT